jgi:hypothetical protein
MAGGGGPAIPAHAPPPPRAPARPCAPLAPAPHAPRPAPPRPAPPRPAPPRPAPHQADIIRLFKLEERFSRPLDTPGASAS